MKKFSFRLQKVLEYRELTEGWAKDAYLDARVARLEADALLTAYPFKRTELCSRAANTVDDRLALQSAMTKIDDDERAQTVVVGLLTDEEGKAFEVWQEKRRDLQALEKLRDNAYGEWQLEETRSEQAELDEFAVLSRRRKAA